ncbi:MAG: glycoside hydrolase family 3 C-terminal domain-containing protein [Spirochaetaceae bacterium]|jgi:beta-glucosidase|nr:glycoside hydrolase family 3 C-terminal domain-containing protein [Spirochaetaceae bacterium]
MARDLGKLVAKMTLEEKAGLCSGADHWHTRGLKQLRVPSVMMSDGPHGLRKQDPYQQGTRESIKAVCFPAACATASSFDRDLLRRLGEALGDECQAEHLAILLGPAINIKRSPLCGRNFEYMSEDPFLTGELAAEYIRGVQSKNIGTSLKHFAANNQETRRLVISAKVDEQALREIYLPGFEIAVKKAQPWTIMASYNRINGVYSSENRRLLTDILRDEWGFEGFVMSDWGAVNERVKGLEAGLELEMPSSRGVTDKEIVKAVKDGSLDEAVLDRAVERILRVLYHYQDYRRKVIWNKEIHHNLAVQIEEESAVLLKNENNLLPLDKGRGNGGPKIAFIGEFAEKPRYQGGGSSHINPFRVTGALEAAKKIKGLKVVYAKGFYADRDAEDKTLFANAVEAARGADAAVIFAGLPESFESEGYDREHMALPACQNKLIQAVTAVQPNTVVVLHNGSPVEMPWADSAAAILELYLGGQGIGEAAVRLLFGDANPSGRLAETFPLKLEDNPSYLNFPGNKREVVYAEGIFVGYRYYDTKRMAVAYPFGHGLSYTTFLYDKLTVDKPAIRAGESLKVTVDVTNTGGRAGKEVVQLYVRDKGTPGRPDRELKGFVKLSLKEGETKTAEFVLDDRAFSWYNTDIGGWYITGGSYEIIIGRSSRDTVLSKTIKVEQDSPLPLRVDKNSTTGDLAGDPRTRGALKTEASKFAATVDPEVGRGKVTYERFMDTMQDQPLRNGRSWFGMTEEQLEEIVYQVRKKAD